MRSLIIRYLAITICFQLCSVVTNSQEIYSYEPSKAYPFGLPNPDAPQEILDFAPLIGECNCLSTSRNADQTWADPINMVWRFKYIMNGMGIQDETLKSDGKHSGSIRQFIADSSRWYVHYYSSGSPSTSLPVWEGTKSADGDIILYREQKAPNGMDGYYKLNFYDIDERGFKWLGEWVDKGETFSFPTWKIECERKSDPADDADKKMILAAMKAFSRAYMDGDYDTMAEAYTISGKIFPNNTNIIEGREAIKERWIIRDGSKILHHEITPDEITILGDHAYDYGYYNGKTQSPEGKISPWKGKYVIVWQKEDGVWKMHLDIWNSVPGS